MSYPGSPVKGQGPGEGEEKIQTAKSPKTEDRREICSTLE